MIPLISSICCGPLGVCQLPRFWWKVLLRKAGLLDEEYPDCSGGLDAEIHATVGRKDEGTLTAAVVLNHVEDWYLAHAALVK